MRSRCDVCGKFRRPEQLREMESRELADEYGHLRESWWLECDSCRGSYEVGAANVQLTEDEIVDVKEVR